MPWLQLLYFGPLSVSSIWVLVSEINLYGLSFRLDSKPGLSLKMDVIAVVFLVLGLLCLFRLLCLFCFFVCFSYSSLAFHLGCMMVWLSN